MIVANIFWDEEQTISAYLSRDLVMLSSSSVVVMASFSSDDQTERLKVTFSRRKETSH